MLLSVAVQAQGLERSDTLYSHRLSGLAERMDASDELQVGREFEPVASVRHSSGADGAIHSSANWRFI